MEIGPGQGGSLDWHVKVVVADTTAFPDIAVLLVATSEITAVLVVKLVISPTVTLNERVAIMFTALPEIEPLMELMIWPGGGGEVMPEIDEPV
jgi:hypothetical protein